MMVNTLILGRGYVGSALSDVLSASFTHSTPHKANENNAIYFNLTDKQSWQNLPPARNVIWTFPAAPLALIREIHTNYLTGVNRLLVYASTSCYLITTNDEIVTEQQPLDHSKERVAGEEYLRQQGATILTLGGIYGPHREPVNWLRMGRIRTPDKRVNLIHRDDIVAITALLLNKNLMIEGERYNLTDGQSRFWKDIARHYSITLHDQQKPFESKIICNRKILALLGDQFQFRKLIE